MKTNKLNKRIILVDADYADKVCGILRVHFQQESPHTIPVASLPAWLVCCALDAGWGREDEAIQVVFVHSAGSTGLAHFAPSAWEGQIDGQAFTDQALGEFLLSAVEDGGEARCGHTPLFVQCVQAILNDGEQHSLALVADVASYGIELCAELARAEQGGPHVALSMEPLPREAGGCAHVVLGFGLMHALSIRP